MVIENRTGHAPAIAELRERGPVHPIDFPRGVTAFLVVDHEHGRAALSDPRLSKDIAHSSVLIDGEQFFGGTMLVPALTAEARARRRDAAREFNDYLVKIIAERRARPEDDLISALLGARDGDAALTAPELLNGIALLLIAGHETTVNLIGNGVLALLQAPDQLELLRTRPDLLPSAIEELLRYDGPVERASQRIALTDMEIAGTPIPKGTDST